MGTLTHPFCTVHAGHRNGVHRLLSVAERWEQLFTGLEEAATIDTPDEMLLARVNTWLGAVHLVQPFKWVSWGAPFPERAEIPLLSLVDCIKQITRIVRADRTNEGVLWGALQSGALIELCRVAHRHAAGQPIGRLEDLESQA